jgi:hypothetical protein
MGNIKLNEFYIFGTRIKNPFLIYTLFVIEIPFVEFRLLLARVAPYLQFATMNCLIIEPSRSQFDRINFLDLWMLESKHLVDFKFWSVTDIFSTHYV